MTIVEAPDNETVAHLAVDLGSRGTVNVMTLSAISIDAFTSQLERSEQLDNGPTVCLRLSLLQQAWTFEG